ncbi:hypothetical protein [uncultured Vagococcus sp.]|uniref:hypothetical protein n=1 Tax=uncultured Vagococcus sp. TaxID=189676 RepID=UPI0028D6D494|nr:hypothetical protein [uncultured Vagococcus sp.]
MLVLLAGGIITLVFVTMGWKTIEHNIILLLFATFVVIVIAVVGVVVVVGVISLLVLSLSG